MKTIHRLGLLAAGLAACAAASAADVGVSVSVNQPGFFGRIDINQPPPPTALILPQPVLIAPPPVHVVRPAPVYLRVPPGHEKKWGKHCAKYNACGQPVYFVKVQGDEDYERGKHKKHKHKGHDDDHGRGEKHGKGHD